MVYRLTLLLGAAMLTTSCGRTFRSCAAYMMIIGPNALSITCPPPGFKGTESSPIGDSVTVQDNAEKSLPRGKR